MRVEPVTLDVDGTTHPGRMNVPAEPNGRGILMVPGAGHGPFGDVFLRFARAGAERGYVVARFETWPFPADVESKSDADYRDELAAGVEFLRDEGCSSVVVVAKSFGGRVALRHHPPTIDGLILWAPAVEFDTHEELPAITADELAGIEVPVTILQGTDDEVVTIENATQLAEHLPRGELITLPEEDHSFLRDHRRVIEETLAVLDDSPA